MRPPLHLRDLSDAERTIVVGALGEAAALVLAWTMVPVREVLPVQSVAVVLLGVVVAAASFGGRVPAVGSALVAGLALNYFHTQPYGRLKIDGAGDRLTFVVLVLGGLVVAQLVGRTARDETAVADQVRLTQLTRSASGGLPVADTLQRALDEIRHCLCAHDTWIEAAGRSSASGALPVLDERGLHGVPVHHRRGGGSALPEGGVQIPLGDGASPRVIVRSDAQRPVSAQARRHAVAVAAVVGLAFAAHPTDPLVIRFGRGGGAP